MTKLSLKRITVKIGTKVITDADNRLNELIIKNLADQISELVSNGIEVIVVSSGAIGAGLGLLKLTRKNRSLAELQAIASVGQSHLMDIYNKYFNEKGFIAGQILLTQEDFNSRKRFLNIRHTINTLLEYKAIPIINENDSVSTEEIRCGDNDRLSSLVAGLADSDMLVMLTDVDGVYDRSNKMIKHIDAIDKNIESLCRGKGSEESTGGMATKLAAARNAAEAGIPSVIARGTKENVILDIAQGKEIGTTFSAQEKPLKARKRWILFGIKAKGKITIDKGAEEALLERNKSLLPSGILGVFGRFVAGDVVEIITANKKMIARGLVNYSSEEIERIKGKKTGEIEKELGSKSYDEVVHRDNLAILK